MDERTIRADVAVVGGGVAGMSAAIHAADAGADVVLLERTSALGGNCRFSGGNLLDLNGPAGLEHLQALAFGKTPTAVLAAYADGLARLEHWLHGLGADTTTVPQTGKGSLAACWPNVPGAETVRYYRMAGGLAAGSALVNLLAAAASRRVNVIPGARAADLILGPGHVTGVLAEESGKTLTVHARSVLLCTGGRAGHGLGTSHRAWRRTHRRHGLRCNRCQGGVRLSRRRRRALFVTSAPGVPLPLDTSSRNGQLYVKVIFIE